MVSLCFTFPVAHYGASKKSSEWLTNISKVIPRNQISNYINFAEKSQAPNLEENRIEIFSEIEVSSGQL